MTIAISKGEAYFYDRLELVNCCRLIAVIDVEEPEKVTADSDTAGLDMMQMPQWDYRQRAKAKVVRKLKNDIPDNFVLHGSENNTEAQCKLKKGRFLAFLTKDGIFWVGANWQLSLRPIVDNKIEWYVSDNKSLPMTFQAEKSVIAEIQTIINEPMSPPRAEQAGADQPATKPADNPSVKGQPSKKAEQDIAPSDRSAAHPQLQPRIGRRS